MSDCKTSKNSYSTVVCICKFTLLNCFNKIPQIVRKFAKIIKSHVIIFDSQNLCKCNEGVKVLRNSASTANKWVSYVKRYLKTFSQAQPSRFWLYCRASTVAPTPGSTCPSTPTCYERCGGVRSSSATEAARLPPGAPPRSPAPSPTSTPPTCAWGTSSRHLAVPQMLCSNHGNPYAQRLNHGSVAVTGSSRELARYFLSLPLTSISSQLYREYQDHVLSALLK